jgi:OmpA-OmpF porin, OOP family
MKRLLALAVATLSPAAFAEDYLGTLKPPQTSLTPGLYTFAAGPVNGPAASPFSDNSVHLKLGYKYSRYFSVEGEFVDFGRNGADIFASPGNLASGFRSTGFGVDTIATLPLWRFSFYGRLGAYRGDRNGFGTYSTTLLGDSATRGTRVRYGLGMRYDFTKAFGIRAELERYSPLGAPIPGEIDADQFSVGVSWRF